MDYHSEEKEKFCKSLKDEDCLVLIDDAWESFYFYVALPQARSYTFISPDMLEDTLKQQEDACVIATSSDHKKLLGENITNNKLFSKNVEQYYYYDPLN